MASAAALALGNVFREVVNQSVLTKSELVQEFTLAATDVETLSGLPANRNSVCPAVITTLRVVTL